ncbi:MAG: hypothetical protein ACLUE2_16845, partial [Bacteroides cellulosilyticus]
VQQSVRKKEAFIDFISLRFYLQDYLLFADSPGIHTLKDFFVSMTRFNGKFGDALPYCLFDILYFLSAEDALYSSGHS